MYRMTNTRNIKFWICMVCMATSMAAPAPPIQLDIIDMAAISRMTPQQLESLAEGLAAEEIMRTKRSSAQSITSAVVSKASSGIQSKIGFLSQASAGASSFITSASGKSGHEQGYSYEPHSEKVDYWGLKKSILHTLFQAIKAITGGVTILKGQLIKGGGALAATLGKAISSKGDVVSNFGKKIVSSAVSSDKKPISTAVYGPPPTTHIEYGPPSAYGATAPAHFSHTGPASPTGFASHKYPSHLDGRGKLSGVHAGLVILTPLGDAIPNESQTPGSKPLAPPPSFLNSVYSAVQNVFSTSPPIHDDILVDHVPPPPQPVPPFRPTAWGAVNSYGEPAMADTYTDYGPLYPPYDYATSKLSVAPPIHKHSKGLTPSKIKKINANLEKLNKYLTENQRSSEEGPRLNKDFAEMVRKGLVPLLPTPVITDDEIGVLPADFLPDPMTTTTSITTTIPTTTTTQSPKNSTETESARRKKDTKFILRGNRIVQV